MAERCRSLKSSAQMSLELDWVEIHWLTKLAILEKNYLVGGCFFIEYIDSLFGCTVIKTTPFNKISVASWNYEIANSSYFYFHGTRWNNSVRLGEEM